MFLEKNILQKDNLHFTNDDKTSNFLAMQNFILEKQKNNENFYIGRLSGNEALFTGNILSNTYNSNELMKAMLHNAGIKFNCNEDIIEYTNLYNKSILNCELLGVWNAGMHHQAKSFYNYIIKNNINFTPELICVQSLEPYYFMDHKDYKFYEVFKNKKILIITSHYHTTGDQLKKLNNIFSNKIFHETSELYIYKPPQQNGSNNHGESWKLSFDKIKTDLKKIKEETFNFDIALVSCGGFGMITCDYIKEELNSSYMYVGGALQLYFGIIGNRWKEHDIIRTLVNNYWTVPLDIDKPNNSELCEGSCYW
jgi:hypothetical protein